MVYSDRFKSHLSSPRNVGSIEDADLSAESTNPVCGDSLQLYLRLNGNKISEARFLAYGCSATIACGSAMTELLTGMPTEDAARISRQDIADAAGGLPSRKGHASALALEVLGDCLEKYERTSGLVVDRHKEDVAPKD